MSDNNLQETIYLKSSATAFPTSVFSNTEKQILPHGTVVNNYVIISIISEGAESVVYLAVNEGARYALKVYNRKLVISESKIQFLTSISSPYIVKLLDYGVYNGYSYEVFPYFSNGTLEDIGRVKKEYIASYANQLNEGLYALHNAGASIGMVHGDIKPSNIFLSDDFLSVLIGDFGISKTTHSGDTYYGEICGTPEFAPPSTGIVDYMRKSPAYDYGSLGLVILFMATGYSYFTGMSKDEIAESWETGIRLPEALDTRIKMLLNGLLQYDEEKRFGYKQVKDWYNGSFVRISPQNRMRDTSRKKEVNASLWFGVFDGQVVTVTSIEELVEQMKLHWEQARNKLYDANFYRFLNSYFPDGKVSTEIKSFLAEGDIDAAVFKTIYTLSDNSEVAYKSARYANSAELVKAIEREDSEVKELVIKGLLAYYVTKMGYSKELSSMLSTVTNIKNVSDSFKFGVIKYAFSSDKSFKGWTSLDQLRDSVCKMDIYQIELLANNTEFLAWLYTLGLHEQAVAMAAREVHAY